jgi:putative endonuclease
MKRNNLYSRQQIGSRGETLATWYLERKGFEILERNYRKKWGEIDIVARGTDQKVHFVEVKSVSYETKRDLDLAVKARNWRPEENVHPYKLRKLNRAIDSWLIEKRYDGDWVIDVLAVRVVPREKYATVKFIPNVF